MILIRITENKCSEKKLPNTIIQPQKRKHNQNHKPTVAYNREDGILDVLVRIDYYKFLYLANTVCQGFPNRIQISVSFTVPFVVSHIRYICDDFKVIQPIVGHQAVPVSDHCPNT